VIRMAGVCPRLLRRILGPAVGPGGGVPRRGLCTIPVTDPGAYSRDAFQGSHHYSTLWHQKLGPIFRDHDLGAVFLSSPSMCEELFGRREQFPQLYVPPAWSHYCTITGKQRGLMFRTGQDWWQVRRKVNPLLMKGCAVAAMNGILETEVEHLLRRWREDGVQDVDKDVYRWLVDVMLEIFLGADLPVAWREHMTEQMLLHVRGIFDATTNLQFVDVVEAAESGSADWRKFCGHYESMMELFHKMIWDRHSQLGGISGELLRTGMTESEVESIISDLMLGATDTTALSLVWILYVLATNQSIQDDVRNECGSTKATVEATQGMTVLKGFVKEAIRVYPVVPFLTRILSEPAVIGGHELPTNTFMLVSSYTMGRCPELFPDPTSILPHRWSRQSSSSSVRRQMMFSSLPFGHGARGCVGRRLAENQIHLLISRVVQEWRVSTSSTVEYTTRMVGLPSHKVLLNLEPVCNQVQQSDTRTPSP